MNYKINYQRRPGRGWGGARKKQQLHKTEKITLPPKRASLTFGQPLRGGFRGVINFPWIFGNAEFSPWKRLPAFTELRKS